MLLIWLERLSHPLNHTSLSCLLIQFLHFIATFLSDMNQLVKSPLIVGIQHAPDLIDIAPNLFQSVLFLMVSFWSGTCLEWQPHLLSIIMAVTCQVINSYWHSNSQWKKFVFFRYVGCSWLGENCFLEWMYGCARFNMEFIGKVCRMQYILTSG